MHRGKAVPMLEEVSILYSNFRYVLASNYPSNTAPTRQTGRPSKRRTGRGYADRVELDCRSRVVDEGGTYLQVHPPAYSKVGRTELCGATVPQL